MNHAPTDQPNSDGRRARGQVSRSKIVAAMIELVREGTVAPTAEQVAGRAEVGLRTVFRHFDDMESLYREINTEIMQLITPLLSKPFQGEVWQERLAEAVERRCGLFESILPFRIATEALRHQSNFIRENMVRMMQVQDSMLRRLLPPALTEDAARMAALNLIMSVDAWKQLRIEQGLDITAAQQAIARGARALTADVQG